MSNLITAYNGIEGYAENGVAYISLERAAKGLGFVTMATKEYEIRTQNSENFLATSGKKIFENEAVRWNRVEKYLRDIFSTTAVEGLPLRVQKQIEIDRKAMEESNYRPKYISYPVFFLLAMKANNAQALKFQLWISYDVVPSILKHGFYVNPKWGKVPKSGKWTLKNGEQLTALQVQQRAREMGFTNVEERRIQSLVDDIEHRKSQEGTKERYPYTDKDIEKISLESADWYECLIPDGEDWDEYIHFEDCFSSFDRLYSEKFVELVKRVDAEENCRRA